MTSSRCIFFWPVGQPRLDRVILCPWLSLPVTEGSQGSNPRPSDLKANMLYAVGPRFHYSVWQAFLASLRPPGFWINLSNKQLHAKITDSRINNEQDNFWKVGEREETV